MTGGKRTRLGAPAVLAASLALTLGACEAFQPPPPPPSPVQAAAPAAVTALPPPPPRKPAPPGQSLAHLPPPAAPGEQPAAGSFERLIGLDQPHVAELIGDPGAQIDSPPATIWRYASGDCEADVYFYLDLQSQTMRALHYEVRSHDLPERAVQRCYDALAEQRRGQNESVAGSDRPR